MARIVLNTFGSLGDLHPFLAIAMELQKRGHSVIIATSEVYRKKIEGEKVGFAPVRPDVGEVLGNTALLEKIWDQRRGTEYLLKEVILPHIQDGFEDLTAATRHADLLITHSAGYAGPIAAEAMKLCWLSVALQPMTFFSATDPPVLGAARWLRQPHFLGRWPFRLVRRIARLQTGRWVASVRRFRRSLGLSASSHPLFEGQFSPYGTLALFSKQYAQPQPDWPPSVTVTGFVFYDQLGAGLTEYTSGAQESVIKELDEFLQNGPPPVLFTLGSSAVMFPGAFFEESLRAAQQLGIRAVLLAGNQPSPTVPGDLKKSIFVAGYAPYSQLMPEAALTVHQGGIGTTAQALRAGKPMLIVPWAHDQPDNAERARKLGVSRTLERARYTASTARDEIEQLIDNSSYAQAASAFRDRLVREDGLTSACDAIETTLAGKLPQKSRG